MRLKFGQILIAVLIMAFFVLGVPILINECYKYGGYVTIWGAADVLSYYGDVLGASIAVATLA